MRPSKNFEEFLKTGIVKKRKPDIARARSLIEEAEKRKKFLDEISAKIGLSDENANYFIENSYDVIIEIIRAKLHIDGFNASGEGAHEGEVAYMERMGFPAKEMRFMNDLRFFRNGILYYGKDFDAEYGNKVIVFLDKVYPKLKKIVKQS